MIDRLDEAAALCRKYGLPDDELRRGAEKLRRYHVRAAVLGGFNAGKSSLVNALAGAYLSRVSLCEETAVPIELFYGTQGVQVMRDGHVVRSDPSVLRQSGALDGAQSVSAALPLPALRAMEGVSILDTPPLAAAGGAALMQAMRGADAYILAAGADAPVITASATAVLKGLPLAEKPVLAVLTKCDQFSPSDARAIAAYLQSSLRGQLNLPKLTVCRASCAGPEPDVGAVRDFLRALAARSASMAEREGEKLLALGSEPLERYLRERIESSRLLEPELERKAEALNRRRERLHDAVDTLNERSRAVALAAAASSAEAGRETLAPLAAPLAYLLLTGQNAAVYADSALRSVLRAEAKSRLAPVLAAYEKTLRRLSALCALEMPAHGAPDAEACAEETFSGTDDVLAKCGANEAAILQSLQSLLGECLKRAALSMLDEARELLAAPLYGQLASLQKATDDARRQQHSVSAAHRRTLDEMQADLTRLTELSGRTRKEGTENGV